MRLFTVLLVCVCVTGKPGFCQSLRDRAKQEGGRASSLWNIDYPYMSTPELVSQSDFVLQGRIIDAKSHLGSDESYVVTDYTIAPLRFVRAKRSTSAARPGETTEIVVRRIGGQATEGNLHFGTKVDAYPESESFKVGEEVLVFLQYDSNARLYTFTGGPLGAYRVQSGRVQPMTKEVAKHHIEMPKDLTTFIDELGRLSR